MMLLFSTCRRCSGSTLRRTSAALRARATRSARRLGWTPRGRRGARDQPSSQRAGEYASKPSVCAATSRDPRRPRRAGACRRRSSSGCRRGGNGELERGVIGGVRPPGIDHNQLNADRLEVGLDPLKVTGRRSRHVAPPDDHASAKVDVGVAARRAVGARLVG